MAAVLVVDLNRVLDESAPGRRGAALLQTRFDEARAQYDKLRARGTSEKGKREADAAAAAFERNAGKSLDDERAKLRGELLTAARPIIAALMQEKKADLVVDAIAVLAVANALDVTDEVIKRLA